MTFTRGSVSGALEYLKPWRTPIALAALLIALQVTDLREALEYSRPAVSQGQLWRLVTASLVHLGWAHLGRDLVGLCLIWALASRYLSERSAFGLLCLSALAVGAGLFVFSPGLGWYVGISGALFGLYTAGVLRMCKEQLVLGAALFLSMLAILAWTLYAGGLPGEAAGLGGAVIPQAHLYGAIGGAMTTAALEVFKQKRLPGSAAGFS